MADRFDWLSHLATTAYASFPEAPSNPVIGITGNYAELTCKLAEGYYKSIVRAGGVPVIIPPASMLWYLVVVPTTTHTMLVRNRGLHWVLSTKSAICRNCLSPNWPTTVSCQSSASVAASRPWRWLWADMCVRISAIYKDITTHKRKTVM